MPSSKLVISPAARDDLRRIYQFGSLNWGTSRAASYLNHLKEQLWLLTKHPELGVNRDELFPSLRSLPVNSHVVFYRLQTGQIEVVRVLHGRQDPDLHLK